jgi:hypothetical protein
MRSSPPDTMVVMSSGSFNAAAAAGAECSIATPDS